MSTDAGLAVRPVVSNDVARTCAFGDRHLPAHDMPLPELSVNVRAGRFHERAGFAVERVEEAASGGPQQNVTWGIKPMQWRRGAAAAARLWTEPGRRARRSLGWNA